MDPVKYSTYLSKYTTATLNTLAVSCGFPSSSTKAARIAAIISHLNLYRPISPSSLSVLSIDVGIKNFSYCLTTTDITSSSPKITLDLDNWRHLDLHHHYGRAYQPLTNDASSLIDSKKYLSHLANSIVDDVILTSNPQIITIENQRTRSNGASSTLPNVLLNYTLENMIYSSFHTHQLSNPSLRNTLLIPLNSRNMVNFWINRFLDKNHIKFTVSLTKKLRIKLFISWLIHQLTAPKTAPFTIAPPQFTHALLQLDFPHLSPTKQLRELTRILNEHHPSNQIAKLDDLIDSCLYNFMMIKFVHNQRQLVACIDSDGDLIQLIHSWDTQMIHLLSDLVQSSKLPLA